MSFRLAQKSILFNRLQDRYRASLGDLRDVAIFQGEEPFDLVFGSPPYWPVELQGRPQHPQRVPALLEVRGTVAAYAVAAARLLAPGGVFACVFPSEQRDRAQSAFQEAGLLVIRRRAVVFKEGNPYGIDLFVCSRRSDLPPDFETRAQLPEVEPTVYMRTREGRVHASVARIRLAIGFNPGAL